MAALRASCRAPRRGHRATCSPSPIPPSPPQIIIDHKIAINKAGAHGPRTIHAQCKSNTGACTSSLVIAHVCKATNLCKPGAKTCVDTHAQCACTCKKPADGQSRDHHVITQLPNQFDLTNNQRKPVATTMAIGEEGRKVKK
jgi:hypothetical protein